MKNFSILFVWLNSQLNNIFKNRKYYFKFSFRGFATLFNTMLIASAISALMLQLTSTDVFIPMIFILAVSIISYETEGYFYGIIAAILSVFAVNWAFTYPYMKFNFTIYGYPLTFITMLTVGIVSSALASKIKESEKNKNDVEREKTRANLLRAMSHDIRTPLTSISGNISAVLDNENTLSQEERVSLLQDAKNDTEWLYRMVENLLSITRISSNPNQNINKNAEIFEEIAAESVYKFQKRNDNIIINVSVPDELIIIPIDAMLVEQVFINLFENAVIHGNATEIKVDIIDAKKYVDIKVIDNGTGIKKDIINHLFDGSLQLSKKTDNDKNKFMGIGLMVCKTIVESHGGNISAHNNDDKGATFEFTLKKDEEAEIDKG